MALHDRSKYGSLHLPFNEIDQCMDDFDMDLLRSVGIVGMWGPYFYIAEARHFSTVFSCQTYDLHVFCSSSIYSIYYV
jgi:hypothetical protein